jgi:hypothetical protein
MSADLARLYLKTLVSVEVDGVVIPVGEIHPFIGSTWHVITGWNPGDARPSQAENEAANDRLRQMLATRGLQPVRAIGADPDSDHAEESWAVAGLDDQEARAIGAEFGQVAVFRIADGAQTVLACTEDWSLSRSL